MTNSSIRRSSACRASCSVTAPFARSAGTGSAELSLWQDLEKGVEPMYASVTTFELRGSIDQVLSLIREFLLPAARSQPGFVDLQVLTNPGLGRTFLISWWQTERRCRRLKSRAPTNRPLPS